MTPDQSKLSRARMAEQPFAPSDGPLETHSIHALNYIAFYLGEIDHKMERIANALEGIQASSGSSAATMSVIQRTLAAKT